MHLQYLKLYETSTRFYVIASDASRSKFYLLKIDRINPYIFTVGETEHEYSEADIIELLATVSEGSSIVYKPQAERPLAAIAKRKALVERLSNAFGLLGAVRFLEGYYILLVTKARVVSTIGYHSIYKIEEVTMIYTGIDGAPINQTEQRYVKLFQSVDLSTDFYFSYSYDISRTLQENALGCQGWSDFSGMSKISSTNADQRFIWNAFLLEPFRKNRISERWLIEIVHGYISQQIVELPCSRLSIILIGRRSSQYAGTRYLKRGANFKGFEENAYVQRRGSVPLIWSQDPATRGVVGRPLIFIDINEPHSQTTAAHFRDLRKKYGNPIIVMNLVKRREKRKHETLLHDQFLKAINYLNLFLPRDENIAYLSFDVARCNKTGIVLAKLDEIGLRVVLKQGWFQSFPPLYCHSIRKNAIFADFKPNFHSNGRFLLQSGISRTNCVDCLDRTNVAQFGIGRVALGFQLYSMGYTSEAIISPSSEVCRMYEDLFDELGDTLALQYAGSQLVHSIKHYKKISAFQERSRDVIQTLSRYYSNTFGDYDKQNAINLFLGIYRPNLTSTTHLWDLSTDYYLHFPIGLKVHSDYCAWFLEPKIIEESDLPERDITKDHEKNAVINREQQYNEYYRVWEVSQLDCLIREQKDLQKSISVEGVNQYVAQGYSFAKLWKLVIPDSGDRKIQKINKQEKVNIAEDEDEEDEPVVKSDAEVHYNCGFEEVY
ncbi:unnamed protein product [Dracunculus medinensis]|uniref:SAC domain-containing protein n=1 Tax=Dracunculus medinensis TaxID=318479 RepID=A0A0N4U5T9_DRAME|nr:unnamed protein product [Dracunculus medinensis]